MSDSSIEKEFKIELLKIKHDGDNNNYAEFEYKSKLKLQDLGLWKYIQGPESVPPQVPALRRTTVIQAPDATTQEMRSVTIEGNEAEVAAARQAAEPWRKGDLRTHRLIVEAVPSEKMSVVRLASTAQAAWMALREDYRPINALRAQRLHQDIMSYKCNPGVDATRWVDKIRSMYAELMDQDMTRMSDITFAPTLAGLIPTDDTWRSFAQRLRDDMDRADADRTPFSSSKVIQRIKAEAWAQGPSDTQQPAEVLYANDNRSKRSSQSANLTGGLDPKRRREDHLELRCTNKYCNTVSGHLVKDCFAHGGGKEGQYPDWWKGKRDLHLHPIERRKRRLESTAAANVASEDAGTRAMITEVMTRDREDDINSAVNNESGLCCMNVTVPADEVICHTAALTRSANPTDPAKCYLDSGATRHIFYDRAVFENYRQIDPVIVKGFETSLRGAGTGVGDVILANLGGRAVIKLTNVLHVPGARLNLMSLGCLDDQGMKGETGDGQIMLTFPNQLKVTGEKLPNKLYLLHVKPIVCDLKKRISGFSLADRISGPLVATAHAEHNEDFSIASSGL